MLHRAAASARPKLPTCFDSKGIGIPESANRFQAHWQVRSFQATGTVPEGDRRLGPLENKIKGLAESCPAYFHRLP